MRIKSKIFTSEQAENIDRKFGEEINYFPCMIDNRPALFTRYQIDEAICRAERNPEDIPGGTFFDALVNFFKV